MDNIFIQLAIILGLASSLGFLTYKMKLPLLVAYLFGGLLLATASIFDTHTSKALSFLPEVGLAFVLFLVGMELDLREIKDVGKPIIVSSILQIIITTILGSSIAKSFGFPAAESLFLGLGLAFSSTIVVVKLLLDKKELGSLYGKLALGILILEDLLAVLVLLAMTVSSSVFGLGMQLSFPILVFTVKVVLLFGLAILLNQTLLPRIFKAVSKSQELLFLTALSWCFIYVAFALILGFSVVIGAFLAGVALATSPYHFQIQGKIKPLRDFFITLFFVYLGTQVNFTHLQKVYPLILIFTLFAVIIKPVLFLLMLGGFGFRKHTIFQVSINLSQISEFSLILMLLGAKMGFVSSAALTATALTAVLTIIISSIMIHKSKTIYKYVGTFVGFFERKNVTHYLEKKIDSGVKGHVVVIGAHRMGGEIVKFFQREKVPQIILDFNPLVVKQLQKNEFPVIYGDMADPEVLEALNLSQARMVISSAPSLDDNKLLLEQLKMKHKDIPVVVRAESIEEAEELYESGADLVILPEILAGDFLLEKLKDHLSGKYFQARRSAERDKLQKKDFGL